MDDGEVVARRPQANSRPRATIYDIARETGVSPSTVSRALNNPGRISVATETRIRDAAESLGYRLNPMARALPTGRTGTLALLVSDITNPVFFPVIRSAERIASDKGVMLVLAETRESAEIELATAERLQPSVDGIMLVASRLTDEQIKTLDAGKPVVAVNRYVDGTPSVFPDIDSGVDAALDHLAQLGHKSLGYLSAPSALWINRGRWDNVFDKAVARGLSIVEIGPGAPTMEGGAQLVDRVLASGVTAVHTFNDLMAIGLIRACQERRIDLPRELSVVGFDDIFGADLITPALTTIRSPMEEIGAASVRRLLAEVNSEPLTTVELPQTEFILRKSTTVPLAR